MGRNRKAPLQTETTETIERLDQPDPPEPPEQPDEPDQPSRRERSHERRAAHARRRRIIRRCVASALVIALVPVAWSYLMVDGGKSVPGLNSDSNDKWG